MFNRLKVLQVRVVQVIDREIICNEITRENTFKLFFSLNSDIFYFSLFAKIYKKIFLFCIFMHEINK